MTDLIDLARRWKRSPGFKWGRGMRTLNEETVVFAYDNQQVEDEWVNGVSVFYGGYSESLGRDALPDLSDPATVGLLEYQVLKLYGGEQFDLRTGTAPKMNGEQKVWWRVKNLTGSSIASGSVVLVGTDHVRIACLVDALERYEEVCGDD